MRQRKGALMRQRKGALMRQRKGAPMRQRKGAPMRQRKGALMRFARRQSASQERQVLKGRRPQPPPTWQQARRVSAPLSPRLLTGVEARCKCNAHSSS